MDAHEVLVAGRNLIDREGWTQSDFGDSERGYCIIGALQAVGPDWFEAIVPLGFRLPHVAAFAIAEWNDAKGRTKQEVLDRFDRAIAATAPAPAFDSLTTEPASGRERLNESVVV